MLTRALFQRSIQSQKYGLSSIQKFWFSKELRDKQKHKETFESIVRSNTAVKTALKQFVEGQDLMAYFPSEDPVRVMLSNFLSL